VTDLSSFDRLSAAGQAAKQSATLDAVSALLPEIAASAAQGEADRVLVPDVVKKMADAGIFRMMVPREYGGDSLSATQTNAVIETLATADAAAGWTAMVAVGFNVMMSRFPRATAEVIYSDGPDTPMRGAIAPMGRAVKVDGGYRLSGRWPFASGPYRPKWMVAGATIMDNGIAVMGSQGPRTCLMLVPSECAEFFDTWHTVGLCGTDSRDFAINDQFVPDSHVTEIFNFEAPSSFDEPIFKLPFPMIAGPTHSAVCLGILKATLVELADLSKTKRSAFDPRDVLAQSSIFQFQLAEMAVRYGALDALQNEQLRGLERLVDGTEKFVPAFHMARGGSWVGYIHQETTKIMNEVVELAASAPVYTKSRLQQRWRDARVAAQHHAGSRHAYPKYGEALVKP
jgi:alkylation response protein AidB-like acyl-CoA dehydrogenase